MLQCIASEFTSKNSRKWTNSLSLIWPDMLRDAWSIFKFNCMGANKLFSWKNQHPCGVMNSLNVEKNSHHINHAPSYIQHIWSTTSKHQIMCWMGWVWVFCSFVLDTSDMWSFFPHNKCCQVSSLLANRVFFHPIHFKVMMDITCAISKRETDCWRNW